MWIYSPIQNGFINLGLAIKIDYELMANDSSADNNTPIKIYAHFPTKKIVLMEIKLFEWKVISHKLSIGLDSINLR